MPSSNSLIKLTLTLALAALVTFLLNASTTLAQDDAPVDNPDAPTRAAALSPAPDRQPTVLSRQSEPDGTLQTVVELPAIADTYIASGEPNRPLGANSALLYLGYSDDGSANYGAERILLRFNVDTIPDSADINDARIRLYLVNSVPEEDEGMRTIVRRINSEWDENLVTWNTEPQWAAVRDDTFVGNETGFYEWEITDLVESWVEGEFPNYGVELIGDERVDPARERYFRSRNNAQFFPRLVVDYDEFEDERAPQIVVEPLGAYSDRDFEVEWEGDDVGSAGIDYYDVQYRLSPSADDDDDEDWVDWRFGIEETSEVFVANRDGRYEFRARGVDNAGNVEPFGDFEAATIVDTRAPVAVVTGPNGIIRDVSDDDDDTFTVTWDGFDSDGRDDNERAEGSGIDYYDVQYRIDGGDWILWQSETEATSAPFLPREDDAVYYFEARAVDRRGLAEPFRNVPEASVAVDRQAPFIEPQLLLPIVAFGG